MIIPPLKKNGTQSLYLQVFHYFKNQIECEALMAGSRLPSIRKLSKSLSISKNTVVKAYDLLQAEALVENQQGRELIVKAKGAKGTHLDTQKVKKFEYVLSPDEVDYSAFPVKEWRRAQHQALDFFEQNKSAFRTDQLLKSKILKQLSEKRGINPTGKMVIVASGTDMLVSMLANLLGEQFHTVVCEDPIYPNLRKPFEKEHFQLVPITVNEKGWELNALPTCKSAIYVTPSHQYPTGQQMSLQQRYDLLEHAYGSHSVVIEDDYEQEFRFDGMGLPALSALDKRDCVIYMGSFSKVLMPSLRVAFMVFPERLFEESTLQKHYVDTVSVITQRALALFMRDGGLNRHLKRMVRRYREKYNAISANVQQVFGEEVVFYASGAGLYLLLEIRKPLSEHALIQKAASAGVYLVGASTCYIEEPNSFPRLFLGFGSLAIEEQGRVLHILKKVWE